MKMRNIRSIMIILIYVTLNSGILLLSFSRPAPEAVPSQATSSIVPDFTYIEDLDYFSLKNGVPQMSLSADKMESRGEDFAEFDFPKGLYNYEQKKDSLRYKGEKGTYHKASDLLILEGDAKLVSSDSEYYADKVDYFLKKDLIIGTGNVKFIGNDLKSKDKVVINSENMEAHPVQKLGHFTGMVKGSLTRKKKYEGKMDFTSKILHLNGVESLAQLGGDVWLKREAHIITGGKADIYLENFNKTLKYFVVNDDVKVTEKMKTPSGIVQRKSFSERLEGFGREQKMVLSGAPRVEQGEDVVKGYRITIREDIDLIEVDDAMSDMQVKKQEKPKE